MCNVNAKVNATQKWEKEFIFGMKYQGAGCFGVLLLKSKLSLLQLYFFTHTITRMILNKKKTFDFYFLQGFLLFVVRETAHQYQGLP